MGKMLSFWADVPEHLSRPHVVMERYAAWARSASSGGGSRCGSAEGMYMPTGGQALEDRRLPLEQMDNEQAQHVRNALIKVDELHRRHLTVLYVQDRRAVALLKQVRVPPQLSQVRHLEGLRRFWAAYEVVAKEVLDTQRVRRGTLAHHC